MKDDKDYDKFEYIKNIEQSNFYLKSLGLPIQVGIANSGKFFIRFEKDYKNYMDLKKIWRLGTRDK